MRFSRIPLLEEILELARKHAPNDAQLAEKIEQFDKNEIEQTRFRAEWLEKNGIECMVCGRKFRPLPESDNHIYCSIGCMFSNQ